jgi:hypothetical protein
MFLFPSDARLDFPFKYRSDRGDVTSLPFPKRNVSLRNASTPVCAQAVQERDLVEGSVSRCGELGS